MLWSKGDKKMQDIIFLVYENYRIYILLFLTIFSAALFTCCLLKQKRIGVKEQTWRIVLMFVLCCSFSYCIYRYPMLYEGSKGVSFLLKALLCLLAGMVIAYGVNFLMRLNFRKIELYFKKHAYGIGIFGFLFGDFILNKSNYINSWVAPMYALDYSLGFGSRFFIGSVLRIICGEYISSKEAYLFCEICMVILIILIAWMIDILINSMNEDIKSSVIFLVLMYICSPGALSGMWTEEKMGRLENYTLLLVLIAVCLFERINTIWLKYIMITIISFVCFAIYQGYIFLYFPILFFVMLYDAFYSEREQKQKIYFNIFSIILNLGAFIVFQFFTYINCESYTEMADILSQKTDFDISGSLEFEYFMSISDAYKAMTENFILNKSPRENLFLIICLCIPVFCVVISIWLKSVQTLERKDTHRFFYYLWGLSYIAFVPQFILNVDWGRWYIAITFYTFFSILYMSWKSNGEISISLEKLQNYIHNNKFWAVLILIYLHGFEKFQVLGYIPEVHNLWGTIERILFK